MTLNTKNIIAQSWYESSDQLLRYITSKIHQKEDAEDILQEVFIKTINKVSSLRPDTNLNAWLYTVTRNAINDYFRQKQKHTQIEITESISQINDTDKKEMEGFCCLAPHINELPLKYKEVIVLSEIEGKKHQEIANAMKLSLSAIKSRVVRGRELLKDKFVSCCKYHIDETGKLKGEADCDNPKCNP